MGRGHLQLWCYHLRFPGDLCQKCGEGNCATLSSHFGVPNVGLGAPRVQNDLKNLHWCCCSFWGQFGPNATTFLLASELFPTDTRGKASGISAAVGRLGALAADIILGKVHTNRFKSKDGFGVLDVSGRYLIRLPSCKLARRLSRSRTTAIQAAL
jgi:hypothetical protein